MRELPILFKAPMVRALLDGSKTQTRRVVKNPYDSNFSGHTDDFCYQEFKAWLANKTLDKSWRNHCTRYWLLNLNGMAGVW